MDLVKLKSFIRGHGEGQTPVKTGWFCLTMILVHMSKVTNTHFNYTTLHLSTIMSPSIMHIESIPAI